MIIRSHPLLVSEVRVSVSGEIDMATSDQLKAVLRDAVVTGGVGTVVVDLAEVTFCDSSGMAVLDEMYAVAADRDITFRVANPQRSVRRILEILGMTQLLHT